MTTDQNDQQPPAPGGFQEGIYLETKKSTIGTGSTAKTTEYRSYWVTLDIKDCSVVMVLLDDEFHPTSIKETFRMEVLTGPNWFYIAEGEKRYHRLRHLLDRMQAPQPKPAAAPAQAAPAPPKAANWWDGGGSGEPAANPFELNKTKKPAPAPKKGGWWDK